MSDRSPIRGLINELDAVALTDDPWRADADVIVVDSASLEAASEAIRAALSELAHAVEGPPVIAFVAPGERVAGIEADLVESLPMPDGTGGLAWFQRSPRVQLPPPTPSDHFEQDGSFIVAYADGRPLYAHATQNLDVWRSTTAVDLMARGIPIVPSEPAIAQLGQLSHRELIRRSVAQRRAAHTRARSDVHLRSLLERVGVPLPDSVTENVAAVLMSRRPDRVMKAAQAILRQTAPPDRLVIGLHGPEAAEAVPEVERLDGGATHINVRILDSERSLGSCLNDLISSCPEPLIAKIDDDDLYAPGYLTDAVQALEYSGAALVGKASYLLNVVQQDRTYLLNGGHEETFANDSYMHGGSLVFRRSAWEQVPFPNRPRRVDSLLIRAIRARGLGIYSTSRFEFVATRNPSGHTWDAPAELFVSDASASYQGCPPELYAVSVPTHD